LALWLVALLAAGVASLSLAANFWLVNQLLITRRQVGQAAGAAAQVVASLGSASLDYTVHVDQAIPFSTVVVVSNTVEVPIDAIIPINTQVTVPVSTPLGSFDITLPVNAAIPVNLKVSVPLQVSVPVSATVPVVLDIPIHIELAGTPLGRALGEVTAALDKFSAEWVIDPWPWGGP
jgi:hypothetical protein